MFSSTVVSIVGGLPPGRHVVAYVHRNVAHDAGIGRANRVVSEQLFLRFPVALRRFVIRFGVLVGLLRLVVSVAAGYACVKKLFLAVELDGVVVVDRLFLALRGQQRRNIGLLVGAGSIRISTWPAFTCSPECARISVICPLTWGDIVAERRDLMVATYSLLCGTGCIATVTVCTGRPRIAGPAAAAGFFWQPVAANPTRMKKPTRK